jgi:hypothetical protein
MKIAFCIGNGSSKDNFNLKLLSDHGVTYGCNHLIQTFQLDNTIIVDRMPLVTMLAQNYHNRTNLYTRRKWKNATDIKLNYLNPPMNTVSHRWDNEIHWGSGTHALNLAAEQGADLIVMLGYDLYGKIDPACWIYQIERLFEKYPDVQFVQIQPKGWKVPETWTAENFAVDDFAALNEMLKSQQNS